MFWSFSSKLKVRKINKKYLRGLLRIFTQFHKHYRTESKFPKQNLNQQPRDTADSPLNPALAQQWLPYVYNPRISPHGRFIPLFADTGSVSSL